MFAKFHGRGAFFFERVIEKLLPHFKLTSPKSSNCTISTVSPSKLPIFSIGCSNKISILPCNLAPFLICTASNVRSLIALFD